MIPARGGKHMNNRQRGVTLSGLLVVMTVLVVLGIFGLKLIPSYIEYAKAKTAIAAIAADRSKNSSVNEIRKAFDARANIDDIAAVKASDLEVTKEGGDVVISFAYRKEIPIAGNVGLYVDFVGRSKQ
jgi:Tfp pilus assembly protein PilE